MADQTWQNLGEAMRDLIGPVRAHFGQPAGPGPHTVTTAIDVVLDPCPTCHATLLVIGGDIVGPFELFAPDGPPAEGHKGHLRPHAVDCMNRTATTRLNMEEHRRATS